MSEAVEKEFEIVTSAQVERTYKVMGSNEEQAHTRLRVWLGDPGLIREGLVSELPERQTDTSPQRVREKREVTRPRAVEAPVDEKAPGEAEPAKKAAK